MTKISHFIASGFYSGFLPRVPGTWGSLIFIPIWWLFIGIFKVPETIFFGILLCLAILTISRCIQSSINSNELAEVKSKQDPGYIVIDEWVGMSISLWGIASNNYIMILISFLMFRFFDVLKPGPIKTSEKLPGSIGIIADDLLAGLVVTFLIQVFLI